VLAITTQGTGGDKESPWNTLVSVFPQKSHWAKSRVCPRGAPAPPQKNPERSHLVPHRNPANPWASGFSNTKAPHRKRIFFFFKPWLGKHCPAIRNPPPPWGGKTGARQTAEFNLFSSFFFSKAGRGLFWGGGGGARFDIGPASRKFCGPPMGPAAPHPSPSGPSGNFIAVRLGKPKIFQFAPLGGGPRGPPKKRKNRELPGPWGPMG